MKNTLQKFQQFEVGPQNINGASYTCIFQSPSTGNWLSFETGGHESWGEYSVFDDPHGYTYCTLNFE